MRSQIARVSVYGLGLVMMIAAMSGQALAGTAGAPAPEIDGSTLSAGLAGLTAGVLILRSRRRAK